MGVDVAKDDPGLRAVHDWVNAQFDSGRQTSIEWGEVAPLVAEHLTGRFPA